MDKGVLIQYLDMREETKELRRQIKKIEDEITKIKAAGVVTDSVSGGYGGTQHFKIEGFPYPEYSRKEKILHDRKARLDNFETDLIEKLNEVEEFISTIEDSRMRRIIRMRCIDNLPWSQVADNMGGGNTEDSVRKAFTRFIEKE